MPKCQKGAKRKRSNEAKRTKRLLRAALQLQQDQVGKSQGQAAKLLQAVYCNAKSQTEKIFAPRRQQEKLPPLSAKEVLEEQGSSAYSVLILIILV
jgi:hypothetical protein